MNKLNKVKKIQKKVTVQILMMKKKLVLLDALCSIGRVLNVTTLPMRWEFRHAQIYAHRLIILMYLGIHLYVHISKNYILLHTIV